MAVKGPAPDGRGGQSPGSCGPEIFNTDQGSQFTSEEFVGILEKRQISISMDGWGRCLDNIFVERLWRTVKYEEVYLHDYQTPTEAYLGLKRFFEFYNTERFHQALNYQTPYAVYRFGFKLVLAEAGERARENKEKWTRVKERPPYFSSTTVLTMGGS